MATIAENLQRIETAKSDIRTAIIGKGVDVPSGDTIDTYAAKINSISTGSTLNNLKISDYTITNTIINSHCILQMPDVYTDYTYSGETIPIIMFNDCSKLTGFTWNVPDGSLGKVEQYAFWGSGLKSFNFPSKMAWIDKGAFGWTKIEGNLTLTVNKIEIQSFSNCTGLTSIDITAISIGQFAFYNCTGLTSITVRGSSVEGSATFTTISKNTFENTNCPIYVPADKVDELKTASGWSAYADRLQPIAE